MFVTDYRLDEMHCRRCGAPVPGPAISNGDLCTRCLTRVERLAVRENVRVDQTEGDLLQIHGEDFDG